MNISEAEAFLRKELQQIYEPSEASGMASMVMEEITGLEKQNRLLQKEKVLTESQQEQFSSMLAGLKNHEPVQYLLGKAWFNGMKLFVDRSVLIPRPETDELVDWIVKGVKAAGLDVFEKKPMEADKTKTLKILDVGTGSGCIALALKKNLPLAEVWGCDISEEALVVARRNAATLDLRVDFQGVDFLDSAARKGLPTVNIIVSNPPYVPLKDKSAMQANVVNFEPHTALFVPDDDPLTFYKALADFGHNRLYENGCIYMEIHESLGAEVVQLFKNSGYEKVELKKDMQGKDRMVKVER